MDWRRALSVLTLMTVAVAFPACGKRIERLLLANEHPTVRLGPTRVVASTDHSRTYSVRWDASDLDGQIRHVLVGLDPPSLDPDAPHWTRTTANSHVVTIDAGTSPEAFRRFVILAVDDRGAASKPAVIALGADNIPPQVRITCPIPTAQVRIDTPTNLTIMWDGIDPDGVFTTRPVRYKYLLLSAASEFSIVEAHQRPDSLRRYYAEHPAGPWTGWGSTSSDTTQIRFTNLTPNADYVFVVIAFDEQGDYSPVFSFDSNMLYFRARDSQFLGPRFTVAGETFEYSYVSGGYFNDASHRIRLEVPAGVPVPIRWFATPQPGTCDLRYRWVLDPASLADETPRSNEQTDVSHWSAWSAITTSAALGPFAPPMPPKRATHTLYIEADDGLAKSLAILELVVVPAQATKDLLIVDDTRLKPDARVGGNLQLPSGPWPTAAELDTFLFARGGMPWQSYPAGSVSVPGVFAGYSFDTLGTRGLGSGFVPLSTLVQYRHVIWYVDGVGARNTQQFNAQPNPMTALRAMGLPGRTNALATYVRLGGKVWLAGGGAGAAVSFGFNDPSNDSPLITFSSVTSNRNELGPGRFMYDIAQWRSEFRLLKPVPQILRATGRFTDTPTYGAVPERLDAKTTATDPIAIEAPTRTSSSFFQTGAEIEFMSRANSIVEDVDPDAGVVDEQSTLDTLYRVQAATLRDPNSFPERHPSYVIMTYYHGPPPLNQTFVHSGFPIWFFQRAQCTQLVDFVLHDLWGLNRAPGAAGARVASRRR